MWRNVIRVYAIVCLLAMIALFLDHGWNFLPRWAGEIACWVLVPSLIILSVMAVRIITDEILRD